mmetsp:Transcript_10822/g.16445  ORF Transcript_10822/g.16445 Transcript_10822/m.16445 type:complete len:101 (+) Transcript_10822:1045-1347(+)
MFSLEHNYYDANDIIARVGDPITKFIIIEYGCLEITSEFDGVTFVLERLYQGSVLNHRIIFMEDVMHVQVRASEFTYTSEASIETFSRLQSSYPMFNKQI